MNYEVIYSWLQADFCIFATNHKSINTIKGYDRPKRRFVLSGLTLVSHWLPLEESWGSIKSTSNIGSSSIFYKHIQCPFFPECKIPTLIVYFIYQPYMIYTNKSTKVLRASWHYLLSFMIENLKQTRGKRIGRVWEGTIKTLLICRRPLTVYSSNI